MKDINGKGWIKLSILNAGPKLDLGNLDSVVIFDHNNGASMGSLATKLYTTNNMAGGGNSKSNHVVSSFTAAIKSTIAPNNEFNGNVTPDTNGAEENPSTGVVAAAFPSNSTVTYHMGLPLPVVVGAMNT